MNKSPSISKISIALVKAQAEMPVVKMNAQNPFLKNKYADLGAVIEASRPILSKHSLAIVQTPVSDGDKIGITTMLVHDSGEWLEDTIFINASDGKGLSNAQNAGVVISYLRRYSWASILGLYADEDTDGHKPEQKKPEQPHTTEQPKPAPVSDEHKELVKQFAASFNGVPPEKKGKAVTPNMGKATDEEIRKAIAHNLALAKEGE